MITYFTLGSFTCYSHTPKGNHVYYWTDKWHHVVGTWTRRNLENMHDYRRFSLLEMTILFPEAVL